MRAALALLFIAAVGALALAAAVHPTHARGEVLADTLIEGSHGIVRAMDCDDLVEIGREGAAFRCRVEFKDGSRAELAFTMDTAGSIRQTQAVATPEPRGGRAGDPWAD